MRCLLTGQVFISEMVVPYRGLPNVECAPLIWAMLGHNIACAEACSSEPGKLRSLKSIIFYSFLSAMVLLDDTEKPPYTPSSQEDQVWSYLSVSSVLLIWAR